MPQRNKLSSSQLSCGTLILIIGFLQAGIVACKWITAFPCGPKAPWESEALKMLQGAQDRPRRPGVVLREVEPPAESGLTTLQPDFAHEELQSGGQLSRRKCVVSHRRGARGPPGSACPAQLALPGLLPADDRGKERGCASCLGPARSPG